MVRVYFTLDGQTVEATDSQFEGDAIQEVEMAISTETNFAKVLLITDCTEDFEVTYTQLTETL